MEKGDPRGLCVCTLSPVFDGTTGNKEVWQKMLLLQGTGDTKAVLALRSEWRPEMITRLGKVGRVLAVLPCLTLPADQLARGRGRWMLAKWLPG